MKVHFSRTKQIERGVEACVCVRGGSCGEANKSIEDLIQS